MATSRFRDSSWPLTKAVSTYPITTALIGVTILGVSWTINDFLAWKAFGTGGTPPTWKGYMRMTKFRINQLLSSDDLCDESLLSQDGPRYLKAALKPREGDRPQIMPRTMPQRQKPKSIDPQARERLMALMKKLGDEYPELLIVAPSKTEGGSTDAIYAKKDLPSLNPIAKDRILDHEIAHAHPSENSLHVWVSDPDAREIIKAGWGQRFPLKFVKSGWIMVYAPRNDAEVDVVEEIVKAAISWITGVSV
jgi:Family of unknown function (DUF5519)